MAVEGHCFFLCLPLDLANICEKTGSRLMHVRVSRQAGTKKKQVDVTVNLFFLGGDEEI